MADKKITQLPVLTSIQTTDVLPFVSSPGASPETSQITFGNLALSAGFGSATAWTPTLTSTNATFAYTSRTGRYVRFGNLIVAEFSVVLSAIPNGTLTNAVTMNMPGNCANVASTNPSLVCGCSNVYMGAGYTQLQGFVTPNTATLNLQDGGSGKAVSNLLANMLGNLTNYAVLTGAFCYITE